MTQNKPGTIKEHLDKIVLAAVFLVVTALYAIRPMGDGFYVLADVVSCTLSFAAFAFGMRAFRLNGFGSAQGKALFSISFGTFMAFLGEVAWAVYEIVLGVRSPILSIVTVMWLMVYPFLGAGLYYTRKLASVRMTRNRKCAIVLFGAALFSTMALYAMTGTATSVSTTLLSLFYLSFDMLIIFGAVVVLVSLIGGRLVKPWAILIAAIILNSMNNLIGSNATYQTGNLASLIMKFVYITGAYGFFYYRQSFGAALKRGKEK